MKEIIATIRVDGEPREYFQDRLVMGIHGASTPSCRVSGLVIQVEPPTENMTFEQAMYWIRQGKKVARASWGNTSHIYEGEFLATDWRVVE